MTKHETPHSTCERGNCRGHRFDECTKQVKTVTYSTQAFTTPSYRYIEQDSRGHMVAMEALAWNKDYLKQVFGKSWPAHLEPMVESGNVAEYLEKHLEKA